MSFEPIDALNPQGEPAVLQAMSAALIEEACRNPGAQAWECLRRHCDASLFERVAPERQSVEAVLESRLSLYRTLASVFDRTMQDLGIAEPDHGFLFDFLIPLLQYVRPIVSARSGTGRLIGLAGGPGVGKTTLSRLMVDCLDVLLHPDATSVRVSIDDFYLSKQERARRGFAWRTLPGTHDIDRLHGFLDAFARQQGTLELPCYDLGRDCPAPARAVSPMPDICIFDGAMVGSDLAGYDTLTERLDVLIFLDAPMSLLKAWRFAREDALRQRSNGAEGFSPERMQAFWDEALAPSVTRYVRPNRARADLVLKLGELRRLRGIKAHTPQARLERQNG